MEIDAEYKGQRRSNPWPGLVFALAVLLTLATCYLGKIQALPWQ